MQRSRRALLQRRRALEIGIGGKKYQLYKVSLSLIFVLWGTVFLLNLWFGHGDNYTDGAGVHANGTTWNEAELGLKNSSNSRLEFSYESYENFDLNTSTTSSPTEFYSSESSEIEENANCTSSIDHNSEVNASVLRIKSEKENLKSEWTSQPEVETSAPGTKLEKDNPKSERLSRATLVGLNEFKSRASNHKGKPVTGRAGTITHRLETGGAEHNYASASKGAKVLFFNKEAKGASNILGKDKDKYLRNPCSAEEKFVIVELSEETLVDTIEIANFEHHSSNLKDFELLGSLVYPTDRWVSLGNFTAGNVKHAQRFILQDPKWVRYLKLNLLSHHGSEFYCTVSYFEVYGVDAVERMLEDLISDQDHPLEPVEPKSELESKTVPPDNNSGDNLSPTLVTKTEDDPMAEKSGDVPDAVVEKRPQQAGRLPGDTALKILMQKVRSLDLNLLILERYLEQLNSRYGTIFKELDDEIEGKEQLLEKIRSDLNTCAGSNEINAKNVAELITWKSLVSSQMDNLVRDNAILRSDVERVLYNQRHMENKGLVIFLLSFIFGCLAVTKLFIDMVVSVFRIQEYTKFCGIRSSWLVLLLSCTIIVVILML